MIAIYLIAMMLEILIGAALVVFSLTQVRQVYKLIKTLREASDEVSGIPEAAFAVEAAKLEIRSPKNAKYILGLIGFCLLVLRFTELEWQSSIFLFGLVLYLVTAGISYYYLDRSFARYYGSKYGKL